MTENSETISFAIHPAVIRQLIENQAGTLSKAVLEGVMNGIDAMANRTGKDKPRVDIDLEFDHVVIWDNGRGFTSREEILDVFRVFGLPQTETKTYGRFRIGRGQLFAQGRTTYTSGAFRMFVDYKKYAPDEDLGFKLSDGGDYGDGVTVRVDFYDSHVPSPSEQQRVLKEIREAVRYVSVADVYLNGEKLNVDPTDQGWTLEDDVAYYKLTTQNNYLGVVLYNNGVRVESFSAREWGVTGTVVSKAALPVNQARNQINRSSSQWKQIEKACRDFGGQMIRRKTAVADHEAEAILQELALNPRPSHHTPAYTELYADHKRVWSDIDGLQIWPDVTGRRWSANQLKRMFGARSPLSKLDNEKLGIAFASVDDATALALHKAQRAFVMDQSLLPLFNVNAQKFVAEMLLWIVDYNSHRKVNLVQVEDLAAQLDRNYRLLEPSDLTARELLMLDVFNSFARDVAQLTAQYQGKTRGYWEGGRRIRVGLGDALSWTDGETYIALNRKWLSETCKSLDYATLEQVAKAIVWQNCHTHNNAENSHSSEAQRELFHHLICDNPFGALMWKTYVRHVTKPQTKAPAEVLKRAKEFRDTTLLADAYFWWKDGEESVIDRVRDLLTEEVTAGEDDDEDTGDE